MSVKHYDPIKQIYTVSVSKDELEKAFKTRESYRDFIYENFGFVLNLEDYMEGDTCNRT